MANHKNVTHNDIVYKSKKTEEEIKTPQHESQSRKMSSKRKSAPKSEKKSNQTEDVEEVDSKIKDDKMPENRRINSSDSKFNILKSRNERKKLGHKSRDNSRTHKFRRDPGKSDQNSVRKFKNKKKSQVTKGGLKMNDYDHHIEDLNNNDNEELIKEELETNQFLIHQQAPGIISQLGKSIKFSFYNI